MGEISGDRPGLIPHLRAFSNRHQLYIHGKPFLILGAELQNSTFSCSEYMERVWPRLKAHRVNTVLGNVSWEDVEPREGEFDFALLDRNILAARKHDLHLVLLWFGAFKNGTCYLGECGHADTSRNVIVCTLLGENQSNAVPAHAIAYQYRPVKDD